MSESGPAVESRVVRCADEECCEETIGHLTRLVERFGVDGVAVLAKSEARVEALRSALDVVGRSWQPAVERALLDREDVRDLIAYLQLIVEPDDDQAFARVLNVPARGIGVAVRDEIARRAAVTSSSNWAAAGQMVAEDDPLARRVRPFLDLLRRLTARSKSSGLAPTLRLVVELTGYASLAGRRGDGARDRSLIDELADLPSVARAGHGADGIWRFLRDLPPAPATEGVRVGRWSDRRGLEVRGLIVVDVEPEPTEVPTGLCELVVVVTQPPPSSVDGPPAPRPTSAPSAPQRTPTPPATVPREKKPPVRSARLEREGRLTPVSIWSMDRPAGGDGQSFPVGSWVSHPTYGEGMVTTREGHGDKLKLTVRFSSGMRKKLYAGMGGLKSIAGR